MFCLRCPDLRRCLFNAPGTLRPNWGEGEVRWVRTVAPLGSLECQGAHGVPWRPGIEEHFSFCSAHGRGSEPSYLYGAVGLCCVPALYFYSSARKPAQWPWPWAVAVAEAVGRGRGRGPWPTPSGGPWPWPWPRAVAVTEAVGRCHGREPWPSPSRGFKILNGPKSSKIRRFKILNRPRSADSHGNGPNSADLKF